MPSEHVSRREILEAIRTVPSLAELLAEEGGHLKHELDLEVTVYGRNYGGKKVGPYVRLFTFEPGEAIVRQGEWGGNTFYVVVDGRVEVFAVEENGESRLQEIGPGMQFGEMSVLAGQPRNATVRAHGKEAAKVLEIQRPALRLLRKLPQISQRIDRTYRTYGKQSTLEMLKKELGIPDETVRVLEKASHFRVFPKNHSLCNEQTEIERMYFIRDGFLSRIKQRSESSELICPNCGQKVNAVASFCSFCGEKLLLQDFLGKGFCFGLEALGTRSFWLYSIRLMGRTEVLEIPLGNLPFDPQWRADLSQAFARLTPPPFNSSPVNRAAQEKVIDTGMADGTNLLVMDMDLCVRCGNCSLACHKVHGRSRLLREGIHVQRHKKKDTLQSVLYPAVCMHCKDPECLTGCPTGAIRRMPQGHIDIDPPTCIGCGDCAMQCPYNAITMVARSAQKGIAIERRTWKRSLSELFRVAGDFVPPRVTQQEDLLAIKCNLCHDTPLNPPGSAKQAYSCELNCPTGALVRISPAKYFSEVGRIQGLTHLDETHAVARNIHVSDPPKKIIHSVGILFTVLITFLTLYGLQTYGMGQTILSFLNMRWITGIAGLAVIALTMRYPFRRQIYRRRATPLRYWMLVHSYAGLVAAILIVVHGGSSTGGWLTTLLTWSFNLVIITGIFGIACYWAIPRLLTRIEEEPLLLDSLLARRQELMREINNVAVSSAELQKSIRNRVFPHFLSAGYLLRQYFLRETLPALALKAREKFQHLFNGASEQDQLALNEAIDSAILYSRTQSLIYLHRVIKGWLLPHIVLTSLMLALMLIHIAQVIFFAWR